MKKERTTKSVILGFGFCSAVLVSLMVYHHAAKHQAALQESKIQGSHTNGFEVVTPVASAPTEPTVAGDTAKTEARKSSDPFSATLVLARKALRSRPEVAQLENALSDPQLIQAATETITKSEDIELRMVAVEFLVSSLAWEGNPKGDHVTDVMVELFQSNNFTNDPKQDTARGADKMEIYWALARYKPSDLNRLESSDLTPKHLKLIRYAKTYLAKDTSAISNTGDKNEPTN